MTNNEFAAKISKEFDEKYGTEWESEEQLQAAIDYFMREKKVDQFLDVLRIIFLETPKKDDFAFKMNIAYSKLIIQYKRSLEDPFLSEEAKKGSEFMLQMTSDMKDYVNEMYSSYRQSYPFGTEAEPEPRPKDYEYSDDLINSMANEDWLSVEDVANILNLKIETVYGKVRKREIPVHKPGKHLKFKREDVNEFVRKTRRKSMGEIDADAEKKINRK